MEDGWSPWLALLIVAALVATGLIVWLLRSSPGDGDRLLAGIPAEVAAWRAAEAVVIYDTESIFAYIDGHAEVYLAYGMQRCLARRYSASGGEADLVLDVFEMASAADAFGVFTYDRDGEVIGVGQGGLIRHGWLRFWKERFFVSILAEEDSDAARAAVLELGAAVAGLIAGEADPPRLVAALPRSGLEQGSVRFLHNHEILNHHLARNDDNILELGPSTPAVLARFVRQDGTASLLLVDYPTAESARRAGGGFGRVFLGDETASGPAPGSADGFAAVRQTGHRLAAVIGAETPGLAEALLGEVPAGGGS